MVVTAQLILTWVWSNHIMGRDTDHPYICCMSSLLIYKNTTRKIHLWAGGNIVRKTWKNLKSNWKYRTFKRLLKINSKAS